MTERSRSRPMKPERVRAAALSYLKRFVASSVHLRRVLQRKINRSLNEHEGDRAALETAADEAVTWLLQVGALNDAAYARGVAASLHRRGQPPRAITQRLRQKGLGDDDIEAAIAALVEELDEASGGDVTYDAGLRYAKRRRFGPFARAPMDREKRRKALASMGRAGFPYGVACKVLDMENTDD